MNDSGIMKEIRELLNSGLSPHEVIGHGYAKSTVYQVLGDLRGRTSRAKPGAPPGPTIVVNTNVARNTDTEAENATLRQQNAGLEVLVAEAEARQSELENVLIEGL